MNANVSRLLSFDGSAGVVLLGALALVGLIGGWIFYPYSIGALTRAVRSPWKHFTERCGTALVGAIIVAFVGYKILHQPSPKGEAAQPVPDPVEARPIADAIPKTDIPSPKGKAFKVPAAEVTKPQEGLELPTESPQAAVAVKDSAKPKPDATLPPVEDVPTESAKVPPQASPDVTKAKVAQLKGELAKVESTIESQRARWTDARDTINRLTNFKKTPVKEGSPAYHQCMAASKVINEVESGAPALKAEKSRLENVIKELEE